MTVAEARVAGSPEAREAAKLLRNVRPLAGMPPEPAAAHDIATTARLTLLTLLGALSATRGAIWLYHAAAGSLEAVVARGLAIEGEEISVSSESADALKEAAPAVLLPEDTHGLE